MAGHTNNTLRRRRLIQRSLLLADVTQSEIARRVGVTRGLVHHVIAGRRRNQQVQVAVAAAVGISPSELWED